MPQEFSLIPNGISAKAYSGRPSILGSLRQYRPFVSIGVGIALMWALSFGMGWWEGWAQEEAAKAVAEQDAIIANLEQSDLEGAKDFAAQVRGVQRILRSHIAPSELMGPFEESIHQEVVLTSFDLDVPTRQLRVAGTTPTLAVMGEQFVLWRDESPFVETATLEQFSPTPESQVLFSIIIVVKEGFIQEDINR
jgi:hypothetical protein